MLTQGPPAPERLARPPARSNVPDLARIGLDGGANGAEEMQQLFPEGRVFTLALYERLG